MFLCDKQRDECMCLRAAYNVSVFSQGICIRYRALKGGTTEPLKYSKVPGSFIKTVSIDLAKEPYYIVDYVLLAKYTRYIWDVSAKYKETHFWKESRS